MNTMANVKCQICKKVFYSKPCHRKLCWGKYCSIACRNKSQFNGRIVHCYICSEAIYRSLSKLNRSESGRYFCSKKCQTLWRNSLYVGEKSLNWVNGNSCYRKILIRKGVKPICALCHNKDERVLTVHHKDRNRKNNLISNLVWVCQNCHSLIHRYKEYDKKISNMVTVAQLA